MCLDFNNLDELELMTKWVEKDPDNELFWAKLKPDAPEKFKKLFEEVKKRFTEKRYTLAPRTRQMHST